MNLLKGTLYPNIEDREEVGKIQVGVTEEQLKVRDSHLNITQAGQATKY